MYVCSIIGANRLLLSSVLCMFMMFYRLYLPLSQYKVDKQNS